MTIVYKLVEADTSREIDLVYDAAANQNYAMYAGSQTLDSPLNAKFHTPDDAPPELIDLIAGIRPMFFRAIIQGKDSSGQDDPDIAINNVVNLARWIDGPDQQAARFHIDRNVNRIELHVAIGGATNITILPIVYGNMSSFAAFFSEFGEANSSAFGAPVSLFTQPAGEGEKFTLRNDLASSPHFLEDSNGDGLADGWNQTTDGAAPTLSISSSNWLIGGSAQAVGVNSSNRQGVTSDFVTCPAGTEIAAKVYVGALTGDSITIAIQDSGFNNLDTVTFTPGSAANYQSRTQNQGDGSLDYFYEYHLTGITIAANARIVVQRETPASASSTFFVDGAYLRLDATTLPAGFCSTTAIGNRYDPTSSNESRINYLDVWGVLGDMDALITIDVNTDSYVDAQILTIAGRADTKQLASKLTHWIDSGDFTLTLTDWSSSTDSNRYGGGYISCSATASIPRTKHLFSIENTPHLYATPFKVLAVMRTNNVNAEMTMRFGLENVNFVTLGPVSPAALNTWSIVECGIVNLEGSVPPSRIQSSTFSVSVQAEGSAGTVDVDAIILLPSEKLLSTQLDDVGDHFVIDGIDEAVYADLSTADQLRLIGQQGELWSIKPFVMNRFIFVWHGDESASSYEQHNVGRTADVEITVTPRTRHLIGTG